MSLDGQNTALIQVHANSDSLHDTLHSANVAISQSSERLIHLYEITNNDASFCSFRDQLFLETVRYSENAHPDVSRLLDKYKYIFRTIVDSAFFSSPALIRRVLKLCRDVELLTGKLDQEFREILQRLDNLKGDKYGQGQEESYMMPSRMSAPATHYPATETYASIQPMHLNFSEGPRRNHSFLSRIPSSLQRRSYKDALKENDSQTLDDIGIVGSTLKEYKAAIESIHAAVTDIQNGAKRIESLSRDVFPQHSADASFAMTPARESWELFPPASPSTELVPIMEEPRWDYVPWHVELTKWRKMLAGYMGMDEFRSVSNNLKQTICSINEKRSQGAVKSDKGGEVTSHNKGQMAPKRFLVNGGRKLSVDSRKQDSSKSVKAVKYIT